VSDVVRDRMLVFGGFDGGELNDLWVLNFSPSPQWVLLSPAGSPPSGRHSASLLLDNARDRLLLFGGYDGSQSKNDLWELPLSGPLAWSPLVPPGDVPAERHGQAAVYDPMHDLVLMQGGFRSQEEFDLPDSWVLNFGGDATPALVAFARADVEPGLVRLTWQGSSDVMLGTVMRRRGDESWQRIGLATSQGPDRWIFEDRDVAPAARYRYGIDFGAGPQAQVEIEVPLRPVLAFSGLAPSPAGADSRLSFSLPSASRVRVEAFDAAGRRVTSEELGTFDAGPHRVRSARLAALPPGVYLLRLRSDAGTREARATFVR
jgi:hypothetical protein